MDWLTAANTNTSTLRHIVNLSLDTLDGDTDARMILADLLEEVGRERPAELARCEKPTGSQLLAIMLGALPGRVTVFLGVEFIEHILTRVPGDFGYRDGPYLFALGKVKAWCRDQQAQPPTSPVVLFDSHDPERDLRSKRVSAQSLGMAFKNLARGIRCVLAEVQLAPVGMAVWFDQIGEADVHIVESAEAARQQKHRPDRLEVAGLKEIKPREELTWQLTRTRELLAEIDETLG